MNPLLFWKNPTFAAKSRTQKLLAVFPWVWLAAAYCGTIAFLWFKCRGYIDSDMSAEMILANQLNEEGDLLLSQNWWYSTEIRVFYLQIFYRLGLLLFPSDWFAARVFGQALWLAALIAAYLYVGHGLHLGGCGVWGAAALMCPFGVCWIRLVLLGGSYVFTIVLFLLSFGLCLHFSQGGTQARQIARLTAVILAAALLGMNSIRGIMGLYLPQFAAAGLLLLLRWRQTPQKCPPTERRYFFCALASLFASGCGYLLNSLVLASQYKFNDFNGTIWGSLSISKLLDVWSDFLSLFGYPRAGAWQISVEILSKKGVLGCCGLALAGAVVLAILLLLRRLLQLPSAAAMAPMLMASILLVQGLIAALAENGENNDYGVWGAGHWTVVLPFAFLPLQVWLEQADFRLPHLRQAVCAALTLCVMGASLGSAQLYLDSSLWTLTGLESVCDWLVEQGYTQGYASYWNGPVLTEWSSGQIEVWVPNGWDDLQANEWLQQTAHADPPEGEVFLLSTTWEMESEGIAALRDSEQVVYDDDRFVVVLYSDFEALQAAVSDAQGKT